MMTDIPATSSSLDSSCTPVVNNPTNIPPASNEQPDSSLHKPPLIWQNHRISSDPELTLEKSHSQLLSPASNVIIEVHCSSLGPSTIDEELIDFLHENIYNEEKENLKNFVHNCMIVGNKSMALLEINSIQIANKLINLSQTMKQNVLFQGNSLHLKKYVQEEVCSPSPFISRLKQQKKQKILKKLEDISNEIQTETDDKTEDPKTIQTENIPPTCMVVYGFTTNSNTDKNTTIDNVVQLPSSMSDRLVTEANVLGLPSASFCLILGVLTNHGPMPITKYSVINKNNSRLSPSVKRNTSASSTPTINVTCDSKNKTVLELQTGGEINKEAASPSASLFDPTNVPSVPNTTADVSYAQNIQNIIMPSLNASDLTTVASLLSPPNTQFSVITTPKLLSPNTHPIYYQTHQSIIPPPPLIVPNTVNNHNSRIAGLTPISITKPSSSSSSAYALQINTNLLHTQQQLQMMMSPNGMNTPLVTTPFFTGDNNTPVNTLSFPQTSTNWWPNTQQYPNILPTPPHPNINEQKFYYTQNGLLLSQNNPPPHPSTLGVISNETLTVPVLNNTQFYQSNKLPTPSSTKSSMKNSTSMAMSVNNSVAAAAVHAVLQSGDQSQNERNEYNYKNNGMVNDSNYRHSNRRMITNMLNINTNLNMSPERDRSFGGQIVGHSTPVVMITNLNEDCLTCDKLFTLCGVFGDVHRVKISYHKRDTAFVQLANHRQARHLVSSLNRIQLYGKMIHANLSRMTRVKMPKDSPNSTILFPDAKFLTRDYTSSMKHRYTKRSGIPGAVKYQPLSIGQPSHILHMANLPRDTNAEELRNLLEGHHRKTKGDKADSTVISSPHSTTSNSDGGIGNRIQGIELVNGNTKSTTCQAFARCSSVDVACQILIEYHGKDFFGRDIKISFASRSHMPSDISKANVYYGQTQQSTSGSSNIPSTDDKRFTNEYFDTFYDGSSAHVSKNTTGKRFPYREKSTVHHTSHGRSYDHRNINYYNAQDRYTVQYPRYTENIAYNANSVQNRYQQQSAYVEIPDVISPMMNERYAGNRYVVDNVLSMRNPGTYQTYTVMDGKSSRSESGNRSGISPLNQRNHQRFIQQRSAQKQFVRKYNAHNNKIGYGNIADQKGSGAGSGQSSRVMYRIKCDNY